MSENKGIRYVIDANDGPFADVMKRVQGTLKETDGAVTGLFSGLAGPFGKVMGLLGTITAVLAGGAVFRASVEAAKDFTVEATKMGSALGISATEASTLSVALGDVYADSETFTSGAAKLAKELRTNEDGLRAMGLQTRDSSGNLRNMRDLMLDSIGIVNSYAAGTDRTVAAQKFFGKGAEEMRSVLKLTNEVLEEAKRKQQELGLVVGVENVEATKQYRAAMNDAGDVMLAMKKAIGDALMPVLTTMAEWFSAVGPTAVLVIKGAIGGLVSVFWGLYNVVNIVWEVLKALVFTISEPLLTLVKAFGQLVQGDFKGAVQTMMDWPDAIAERWKMAGEAIIESSTKTRDALWNLFATPEATAAPKGGGKRMGDMSDKKDKADPSFMSYYEAALAEDKRATAVLTDGREYRKQQELEYWRFILANLEVTAKDRVAILRKTADLETDIAREARKNREAIDQQQSESAEKLALLKVDREANAARYLVETGQMTHAQLQELELGFEQRRYEIKAAALQQRMQLLAQDPDTNPLERARIQDELLLLEEQHLNRMQELKLKQPKLDNPLATMEGPFAQAINNMIAKTQSFSQAMATAWRGITSSVVGEISKMISKKMAMWALEKAQAMGLIGTNAAVAGSGAAASQASIPFVGPVLALAAMAAMLAAVGGLKSGVASAAGGFDIPAGINPLTQLHEEEMVLPADIAGPLRDAIRGGGQGAAQAPINLQGVSAGEFFIANRKQLLEVLQGARRDFAF